MIISLDGSKQDAYNEFSATAASAVMLDKYYNIKSGKTQSLDLMIDALKLYNDWSCWKKADSIAKEMAAVESGTKEYDMKKQGIRCLDFKHSERGTQTEKDKRNRAPAPDIPNPDSPRTLFFIHAPFFLIFKYSILYKKQKNCRNSPLPHDPSTPCGN